MTTEQAEAFAQLRTLAAASRLRVRPDDEGWPVIPGRLGQIEYHDGRDLAVFTDRPRLHAKLWAIPGVRRHQTGDQEMRALFPPEALEQVAGVIRTRRRRIQSPAQTQNLTKGPRSAASRPQDRAEAGTPALASSAGPEVHTDGRPTEPGVNARFIHPSGSNAVPCRPSPGLDYSAGSLLLPLKERAIHSMASLFSVQCLAKAIGLRRVAVGLT